MSSELSDRIRLHRYTDIDSVGVSIRDQDTPTPTAAERIKDLVSNIGTKASGSLHKIGDISLKAYVMSTVILLSTGAGLVYERMSNPNYQDVSPAKAVLETAVALGGQVGVLAMREINQSERSSEADSILENLKFFSEIHPQLSSGPIAEALSAYGVTYDPVAGWSQGEDMSVSSEFFPTPEDLIALIQNTAANMGVSLRHPDPVNAVEASLSQVSMLKQICGDTSSCPPVVQSFSTPDGTGMIYVHEGIAMSFDNMDEGMAFIDNAGWLDVDEHAPSAGMKP